MFTKQNPISGSKRIAGALWIVGGTLCLLPRLLFDGGGLSIGVGIMFIILGSPLLLAHAARSVQDAADIAELKNVMPGYHPFRVVNGERILDPDGG